MPPSTFRTIRMFQMKGPGGRVDTLSAITKYYVSTGTQSTVISIS